MDAPWTFTHAAKTRAPRDADTPRDPHTETQGHVCTRTTPQTLHDFKGKPCRTPRHTHTHIGITPKIQSYTRGPPNPKTTHSRQGDLHGPRRTQSPPGSPRVSEAQSHRNFCPHASQTPGVSSHREAQGPMLRRLQVPSRQAPAVTHTFKHGDPAPTPRKVQPSHMLTLAPVARQQTLLPPQPA